MISKEKILEEIKRTASGNNGNPLGIDRFREETGIRKEDWYGKYWSKWTDAQREAGFKPNQFGEPKIKNELILKKLLEYIRELGHFPTKGEFILKKQHDNEFPSIATLQKRLGKKENMVRLILEHCHTKENCSDVIDICINAQNSFSKKDKPEDSSSDNELQSGQVYLLKHGNDYKIGKSTSAPERYKSIQTQMPHELEEIHVIETDDISGIENYWHKRFKEKRLRGEWFKLTAADIKAFKKRKFQ